MGVVIASELLRRLIDAATVSRDAEICGLLLGGEALIEDARPCRNVATDPATRFEVDPAALIAAHRAARTGGPRVIGHYHSHPRGQPTPSPRDAADAAPDGALWLILGQGDARLWRATACGLIHGRFDPVALMAEPVM